MYTKYLSPEELVSKTKDTGSLGISWTFNEPALWFEYTLDGAEIAKTQGLYTNYVTNGFITSDAFDMIAPFLDVYRIDLKGFSERTYNKIGHIKDFKGILEIAERAKKYGMHIEVVTNIISGFNDGEEELRAISSWIKNTLGPVTPWHITRFYPNLKLRHLKPTPIDHLEMAWIIGKEEGL